ncbi:hypothetical protein HKBW3S25_01936, partial [Candidatus Hakubella thermalkaliphila]
KGDSSNERVAVNLTGQGMNVPDVSVLEDSLLTYPRLIVTVRAHKFLKLLRFLSDEQEKLVMYIFPLLHSIVSNLMLLFPTLFSRKIDRQMAYLENMRPGARSFPMGQF